MKKLVNPVIATALLLASGSVLAADAEAGKAKSAMCVACHGANGEGNAAMVAPKLAGQLEVYLAAQMKAFKAGTRTNPMMGPMAAPLSDDDVANLSAYYSGLK